MMNVLKYELMSDTMFW